MLEGRSTPCSFTYGPPATPLTKSRSCWVVSANDGMDDEMLQVCSGESVLYRVGAFCSDREPLPGGGVEGLNEQSAEAGRQANKPAEQQCTVLSAFSHISLSCMWNGALREAVGGWPASLVQ